MIDSTNNESLAPYSLQELNKVGNTIVSAVPLCECTMNQMKKHSR